MAARRVLVALALAAGVAAADQDGFGARFLNRTLRVDLHHTGDATVETYALDRLVDDGPWAGSTVNLVDPFGIGRYEARLVDPASGEVLFSRGFDSLFAEWVTTAPARAGTVRTFHESVRVPMPRAPVRLEILRRSPGGALARVFALRIVPSEAEIVREPPPADVEVVDRIGDAAADRALDLAVLGEGYAPSERGTFRADFRRLAGVLLAQEPFASLREEIVLRAVLRPSADEGCDEPQRGIWRRTALGCRYAAFGSPRYLLTEDNRAVREVARAVPYDLVLIMVNHRRYGGGGIYGLYCTFAAHSRWSGYLLVHELGHALGGLADEYYTSSVAYSDFYPPGVEPAEPNVTALLDPRHLKWADLVTPGTPLPTPWEKEGFDRLDLAYQEQRRELDRAIAAATRAGREGEAARLRNEAEELAVRHAAEVDAYLARSRWRGVVGAFEGAGYTSRGLYRPALDCIMFSKGLRPFCPVCRRHLERVIRFHAGERVE